MLHVPGAGPPPPQRDEVAEIISWGIRVFPGMIEGKTPVLAGWPELATTDSAITNGWWAKKPFNICMAMGRITSGPLAGKYLVGIDYDMKPGQRGGEALLAHDLRGWTDTLTVHTATGGVHKIWWSSVPIANSTGRIAPNVDVRGERGYVIAATSVVKGAAYRREGGYGDIKEIPADLAKLAAKGRLKANGANGADGAAIEHSKPPVGALDQPAAMERTREYLINEAPEAIEGQHGDQTTFMVACQCKDYGLSEAETLQMMLAWWNDEKAHGPWAPEELAVKVANAYRYGQNAPGSADPANEFDVVPDVVKDEGDGPQSTPNKVMAIPLRSAFPIAVSTIPPRDWIVPGLLLRRNISLLVAPPGSGKSLLTLQIAIMVAMGMDWGGWRTRKRCRVLVVNSEDDIDEMRRRLFAAALEMGVDQAELEGWIFLAEAPDSIVIAKLKPGTRTITRTPLVEQLVKTIADNDIGCVIVDPFAETFEGDENSNSEVKWAIALWREVSRRTDSALMLVHHSRKYASDMAGEADVTRGGGALIGVARILCTLFTMTEAEAKTMGVGVDERTDYVRFDDAKANHSRRGAVKWFRKVSVTLENARNGIPGDEVGALVPWKPDLMEGITEVVLKDLIETINAGVPNEHEKPSGSYFTPNSTGKSNDRWVGNVLTKTLGCDEGKAKAILKDWASRGWIESFKYNDPAQRRERWGVRCDATKWPHNSENNVGD